MARFHGGRAVPQVRVRDWAVPGVYAYSGSAMSSIDDKGRLSVPAFLRKDLIDSSNGRTLCLGTHEKWDCLVGFGLSRKVDILSDIEKQWEAAIARGDSFDKDAAGARIFPSIQDLSFDASGRFGLPPQLRDIGGLEEDVFFHGIGTTFCLWSPQTLLDTTHDVPVDRRLVEHHIKEAGKKK